MIDKLIDSRSINDISINRSENPIFNFPDFRNWSDTFIGANSSIFPGNMFPITPSQLSRSLKISPPNGIDLNSVLLNKDGETDKNSEEEDYCEKCQKRFCNKYYLKRHKIEVHKLEFEMENSSESFQLLNDTQQKSSPTFRPSLFNPLFNTSFSNFLLQKSMAPMFANILLPTSSLPQASQMSTEFRTVSSASSSSILSQPPQFRCSQAGQMLNPVEMLNSCPTSFPILSTSEPEMKVQNLATSIFNEVRNSFIKLPSETKPFLSLNVMENGFRDPNRTLPQSVSCTICGLQISGGDSALLDHLYSCHSNEKSTNLSPISKIPPKKDSPMSTITNNESYISPFDAFKSSMAAAKLADRVTCDICHKDLCNKYFLRTHKLKLHGIQTVDSNGRSGNRKDKPGFYEHCPPQFDQLNSAQNFLSSPFPRSSLPDPILAASLFQNGARPNPASPENGCFCPICKRLVSLPYFLPLHMWNVHGIGMGGPNSFLTNNSVSRPNVDSSAMEHSFLPGAIQSKINTPLFPIPFGANGIDAASMGSKWYRKSPNQMRVRCDICDKWICNKYFLRTHKLNKHGLTDSGSNTDVNSDTVSRGFLAESGTMGPSSSSLNIDSLNPTSSTQCGNSPIDLSSSPTKEANCPRNSNAPSSDPNKSLLPTFSCNSIMSNISLRSIWPLRFSLDKINVGPFPANDGTTVIPLDLSTKCLNDRKEINKEFDSTVHQSLVISTAKRLKVKYQKIFRSKLYRRSRSMNRVKKSSFINPTSMSPRLNDCFSCPLCGKLLQDAPRFLHHLTQFHDMVLPGNHSGTEFPSNNF